MIKIVINGGGGYVNDRFLGSKRQSFFIFIEGYDLIIRIILADSLGNGAADQSETDKADLWFHKRSSFLCQLFRKYCNLSDTALSILSHFKVKKHQKL